MSGFTKQAQWTLASAAIAAGIQLVQLAFLARMLPLEYIGILAIVQVFMALLYVFMDVGLANFHVYLQSDDAKKYSAIFWLSAILGVGICCLLLTIAPVIAWFYQQESLTALLRTASIAFIFMGFSALYQAELIKHFKQILLAKIDIVARVFSFALFSYLLLGMTLGAYALIIAIIANAIARLLLMHLALRKEIILTFNADWSILRAAFNYGIYQFMSQVLSHIRAQLDQLLIGKFVGMEALGVYNLAKELIAKPFRFLQPIIQRILFPRLAALQKHAADQFSLLLIAVNATAWSSLIIYSSIALSAQYVVTLLYGPSFSQSVQLVILLSLFGMLRPVGALFAANAQANGKTDVELKWNIISFVISLCTLLPALLTENLVLIASVVSIQQMVLTTIAIKFFCYHLKIDNTAAIFKKIALPTLLGCLLIGVMKLCFN